MLLKITRKDNFRRLFADDDKFAETIAQVTEMADPDLMWCDGKGGCLKSEGEIECTDVERLNCIKRWLDEEICVEV